MDYGDSRCDNAGHLALQKAKLRQPAPRLLRSRRNDPLMAENNEADYTTRRLTAVDALEIPELSTRVNGPGYIHAEVYHPRQLLELNQEGRLVSVVAVHVDSEVVGHAALERPELELIVESGEAMVLPEHRHHHLLDRMKLALEEEARKLGLIGIFGNAVTHHVFSQLTEERYKGRPTSFLLAAFARQRPSHRRDVSAACQPAELLHLPGRSGPHDSACARASSSNVRANL
jgi:hypothetical protein